MQMTSTVTSIAQKMGKLLMIWMVFESLSKICLRFVYDLSYSIEPTRRLLLSQFNDIVHM